MPFIEQPRNSSPDILDHNENSRQLEQTESATRSKSHPRGRGGPFEKHSSWVSPERKGRHGWQACWKLSKCCTSSFLWIGLLLFRGAASLILLTVNKLSRPTKALLLLLPKKQIKPKAGLEIDAQSQIFALSLTKIIHLKISCSDLYCSLCSWYCRQVRRTDHVTHRSTDY